MYHFGYLGNPHSDKRRKRYFTQETNFRYNTLYYIFTYSLSQSYVYSHDFRTKPILGFTNKVTTT